MHAYLGGIMKCPLCAIEMDEHARHGVKIDHCSVCGGVWLDKGELDHLIAAVRPALTLPDPEPVRPAPPPPPPPKPERTAEPPRTARKAPKAAPKPARQDRGGPGEDKGRKPGRAQRYTRRYSTASRLKDMLEEIFDFD